MSEKYGILEFWRNFEIERFLSEITFPASMLLKVQKNRCAARSGAARQRAPVRSVAEAGDLWPRAGPHRTPRDTPAARGHAMGAREQRRAPS